MTKRRKYFIYLLIFLLVGVIAFALIYQFVYMPAKPKRIVELQENEGINWTVENFKTSEIKFFKNGTFHIRIYNSATEQLVFIGIGTFKKTNKYYMLDFVEAHGNGQLGNIADTMDELNKNEKIKQGQRKGLNRVRFVDHNGEIYYFA
jgi:hypothetical protein